MYSKKSLSLLLALSAFGCFMPTTFANETSNAHSLVENNNLIASPNYTTIITKEQYMIITIKSSRSSFLC